MRRRSEVTSERDKRAKKRAEEKSLREQREHYRRSSQSRGRRHGRHANVLGANVPRRGRVSLSASDDPSVSSDVPALLPTIEEQAALEEAPLAGMPGESVGFSRSASSSLHSGRVPPGQPLIADVFQRRPSPVVGFSSVPTSSISAPTSLSRASEDLHVQDWLRDEPIEEHRTPDRIPADDPFAELMGLHQSHSASSLSSSPLPEHLQGPGRVGQSLSRENTPGRSPFTPSPARYSVSASPMSASPVAPRANPLFNWPTSSIRPPGVHPLGRPQVRVPLVPIASPTMVAVPPGSPESAHSQVGSSARPPVQMPQHVTPGRPGSSFAEPFAQLMSAYSSAPSISGMPDVPEVPVRVRRSGGSKAHVPQTTQRHVRYGGLKGMDVQKPSNFSIQQLGANHYVIRAREMNESIKSQISALLHRVRGNTIVVNGQKMSKKLALQYIIQQLSSKHSVQVAIEGLRA